MAYRFRLPELPIDQDPAVPPWRLNEIARELDRLANSALNDGHPLWGAKASRRAAELRELAGVAR